MQLTAPAFVEILNEMRFGKLQSGTVRIFETLSRDIIYDDGTGPTDLYVVASTPSIYHRSYLRF